MPTYYSDTSQSVQSKSMPIASKSYTNDSKTVAFRGFPSLAILRRSMERHGADLSMRSVVDSHAKIFQPLGGVLELTAKRADFGKRCGEWFAKLDLDSSWWKIRQLSLFEDSERCCTTWPAAGIMLHGECFLPLNAERRILESEFGYLPTPKSSRYFNYPKHLPTPQASDCRDRGNTLNPSVQRRMRIGKQVGLSTLFQKAPCPMCVEGMMAWPMGWSGLNALETGSIQTWLHLRGKHSVKE